MTTSSHSATTGLMKTILNIFVYLLAAFGVVVLGLVILLAIGVSHIADHITYSTPVMPDKMVLEIPLDTDLDDTSSSSVLNMLDEHENLSLREILFTLERAADDKHVTTVVFKATGGSLHMAQAQELRAAVAKLRAGGKQVLFFADTYGELDNGTVLYYLAAACDKIYVQPQGFVGIMGVGFAQPFARGLLDQIGIHPDFEKRRDYKTAMDMLTEKTPTAAGRAEMQSLADDLSAQIFKTIAADRKLDENTVFKLRDVAPLTDEEAKAAHLVDDIAYYDAVVGANKDIVTLADYADSNDDRTTGSGIAATDIAFVEAKGAIVRGHAAASPLSDDGVAADDIIEALHAAASDEKYKAVLLRIDSPGGSAIASESIYRAVLEVKAAGKPVIVSMGTVAASGGYYIAAPADKIIADSATLTGSIGVIVGKADIAPLSEKYGVTWDHTTSGTNSAMWSMARAFSPAERARVVIAADHIYDGFKARVAAGRHLSPEAVEAIAQGHVWTGAQAKQRGLVDELGGLYTALDAVRAALKLPADAKLTLHDVPEDHSFFGSLGDLFKHGVSMQLRVMLRTMLGVVSPQLLQSPTLVPLP